MRKSYSVFLLIAILVAAIMASCNVLPQEATTLPTLNESTSTTVQQIPLTADDMQQQTAQTVQADPTTVVPTTTTTQATTTQSSVQVLDLAAQEQAFIDLYQQVSPAVVTVFMTTGSGSGFIVDPDGYIVTNNHVVEEGGPITVTFTNGDVRDAELIGTDPQGDIALIKIDAAPGELTALPLGDSDALQVGQIVVAIGSPYGLESTMTTGIVSGLDRSLPDDGVAIGTNYEVPNVIQTDAAINPGNSGGPLLNLNGEVIGINTAIESPVRANSGVGFAVPSNVVDVVIAQLRNSGNVSYPYLGISGGSLSAAGAEELGLSRDLRGVYIGAVAEGGPAAQAGLQGIDGNTGAAGDIITAIDGNQVVEFDDLLGYIVQETRIGQTVELTILRDGQTQTVSLTLAARPAETTN